MMIALECENPNYSDAKLLKLHYLIVIDPIDK